MIVTKSFRYFFLQPSYWFDWLYNNTSQLSVRRMSPEVQAIENSGDENEGLGTSESTSLLRGNNVRQQ